MKGEKIRVVWICSFSNANVREHYKTKINPVLQYISKKIGRPIDVTSDSAIWNSNALREFEKISGIELHVVTPIRHLSEKEVRFEINGIKYYFFRDENSGLISFLFFQLFRKNKSQFIKNRRRVQKLIKIIQPELVHVIGAENPQYSLALIDIPKNIPTIIQLQALLDRLVNVTKDPFQKKNFAYKGRLEREIISKADFVATTIPEFKDYILKKIKPNTSFLDLTLAMSNEINLTEVEKRYDFVYFASSLSKAGDEALKSFTIAYQQYPEITLNFVGGYDDEFKKSLDEIIVQFGLEDAVFFEGRLPTHQDVLTQIKKSRYALLPLKMDFVPNTIREAICNGLPVVTTITENGTTNLNKARKSILLSEQGDHKAMAENMMLLLSNKSLAEELMRNAIVTEKEQNDDNYKLMLQWAAVYTEIKESWQYVY